MAIQDDRHAVDQRPLDDDDPATGWFRTDVQFPGEMLRVDIGRAERLGSIEMSLGTNGETYPRLLSIATSIDGEQWTPVYAGRTGSQAYRAALANPRDVRLTFALGAIEGRFIRLRLEQAPLMSMPWFVTELAVNGVGERATAFPGAIAAPPARSQTVTPRAGRLVRHGCSLGLRLAYDCRRIPRR